MNAEQLAILDLKLRLLGARIFHDSDADAFEGGIAVNSSQVEKGKASANVLNHDKKFDDAALKLNDFLLNVKRTKFPDGLPISQISEFYSLHPGLKSIIRSLGLKKFIMV